MLPDLIQWFESANLTLEPFYLHPWLLVPDPARYYDSLRWAIKQSGQPGSREVLGNLGADLCRLRAWCVTRGGCVMQGRIINPVSPPVLSREAAIALEIDVQARCFRIVAETETPWVQAALLRALAAVGVS